MSLQDRISRVGVRLRGQSLLADATRLLSGSILSLVVSVGFAPLLSRLYGPAEFGVFGMYVAIVSIGTVIAALRYENAIVLPESDTEARSLVRLSFVSVVLVSILTGVTSVVLYTLDTAPLREIHPVLLWLAPGILCAALYQTLTLWRVRRRHFGRISSTRIIRSGASGSSQIALGLVHGGVFGLIGGQLVGQLVALRSIWRSADATDERLLHRPIFDGSESAAAREYRRFPIYDLPQATLNSFSQQVPVLMLTALAGSAVAGQFVMASRILMLPVTMAGQSIRAVLLQRTSAARNAGQRIGPIIIKSLVSLASLGVLPTALLLLFGPKLFKLVLGHAWYESGVFAALISPWLFFAFIKEAVIGLVPVLGLQRTMLSVEAASFAIRIVAMPTGAYFASSIGAVALLSAVASISNLYVIVLLLGQARAYDASVLQSGREEAVCPKEQNEE